MEAKEFLEEMMPDFNFTIENKQEINYEIEKGDKVYWIKNGIVNKSRIDIITKIDKNMFGDKQYHTKQINGDKEGIAYESYITLAI